MGIFRELGRRTEQFKQQVDAARDAPHECTDCGEPVAGAVDECPACGGEVAAE